MSLCFRWPLVAVCFVAGFLPAVSFAQLGAMGREARPGVITGAGIVTLKPEPVELRMSVQLHEKASTLKEALAKLKTRGDAALLQLGQLGAAKDDVKLSDPMISEPSRQQLQMERMMRMQRSRGGRAPKATAAPKLVAVSSTVTATWKITGDSRAALLQLYDDLKTKITKADLAGINEPKKLTPEEEELAEEQMGNSFDEEEKPGEPQFFFVGRVTEAMRQKAMKDAFAKAKANAEQLAAAAGTTLGELSSVGGGGSAANNEMAYYQSYRMMGRAQPPIGDHENEVIAPLPDALQYLVNVEAAFQLKK